MTDGVAAGKWPVSSRVRAWSKRHPVGADAIVTVAIILVAVPLSGFRGPLLPSAMSVLLIGPLILRRRYPLISFGCVAAVVLVQLAFGGAELLSTIAMLVVLYTVAAYREHRPAVITWVALELGLALAVLRWAPLGFRVPTFVLLSALFTAAFVLGRNVRTRRAYLTSLEDRALRAEHERDQQARLAAAAERTRIAREMHDVVTHNLSVMIALADGAAFAAKGNPVAAEGAARQVSATGRQALTEMHRLLGVLRGDDDRPMRAPQPGIEQLDELAATVRSAGLPISLTQTGRPFPVSPTAQLALYRIVQEALTNVLKHAASASAARVTVRYDDPVVTVEIDDDGQDNPHAPADGHGLGGMAERVAMFDGDLQAGPRPGGGWRVQASLTAGQVV